MIPEETRTKWSNKIRACYEAFELELLQISERDWMFLESIEYQLNQGKDLSMKQSSCLNNIYERIE